MWHIFPLWLVRHVVMCLLIAGLKDKPLIFASDVVNDLSTSVFPRERENGRVRQERKAHFLFFSSTLFYDTSWFMKSGSSLIEMSICGARIMDCFLTQLQFFCLLYRMIQFSTPALSHTWSSFPKPSANAREILHIWINVWEFYGGRNRMIKPQKDCLPVCLYSTQICFTNQGKSNQFQLTVKSD